ncbi:GDSL esterase/lipase [Camellia lanceoleosa]|uniref:GDSL esterase/lipase n=1 Tax=Camellia lanceoleosa TaxID=1840588 RepID=A0ACC0FQM1_9ERIC|nr:GDSL esterase/lipase [Camellia lanceoleosa]
MGTLLTYYYNNQSIGRSAADFMAFSLVDVPPRPAYHNLIESDRKRTTIAMAGINYGSSGCGIFTTTRPLESECFNLEQQIDFFKETVQEDLPYLIPDPDACKQYLAKSIFFISMGANDYFFTYPTSNTKMLYEIGARQFIVNNIGPLGCLPSLRYKTISGQCNEDMNNLIMPYNYRLPKWLKTWTRYDYSGITFVLADSYGLLNHMVYHPQEFGFKDVKHPCCGQDVNGKLECPPNATPCSNRDEYLFFDGAHTSQVANLEFALLCANATICTVIE